MARRGERSTAPVPGDPDDRDGWPHLIGEHLVWMELRGLSPATVYGRRKTLAASDHRAQQVSAVRRNSPRRPPCPMKVP